MMQPRKEPAIEADDSLVPEVDTNIKPKTQKFTAIPWEKYSPAEIQDYIQQHKEKFPTSSWEELAEGINKRGYPLKTRVTRDGDSAKFGFYREALTTSKDWNPRLGDRGDWQYGVTFKDRGYKGLSKDEFDKYTAELSEYEQKKEPYYVPIADTDSIYKSKLAEGLDSSDISKDVEVERDEIVLQKKDDGKYIVVADFKGGQSHNEGGEDYVLQRNDIVFPADKRELLVGYLNSGNWSAIDKERKSLPKTLPQNKELQEGIDEQSVDTNKETGINSFLKDAMIKTGHEYNEEKANKILTKLNHDYDKVIDFAAKNVGIKDVDKFRTAAYKKYNLNKSPQRRNITKQFQDSLEVGLDDTAKYQKATPELVPLPGVKKEQPDTDALPSIEQPTQEEEGSYFGDLGQSLLKGATAVSQGIVRLPSTIYRIAALPQNLLSNIPGLEGLEVSKDKHSNILNFLDENKITEYYDEAVEKTSQNLKAYEQSAVEQWKSGDKTGALKTIGIQATESIPLTALLMATGGAGAATEAGIGIGTFATGQKLHQLDETNPDMSEVIKVTNSMLTGAAEAGSESMSMGSIGIGRKLLEREGIDGLRNIIQNSFINNLGTKMGAVYNIASPMVGEGLTEAAAQYSENYIDMVTGANPDVNLMNGVFDSFLVGTVAGGTMSAPISTYNEVVVNPLMRSKVKTNFKKATAGIEDIPNADYVEAIKNTVENHSDIDQTIKNFSDINSHYKDQTSIEDYLKARDYIVSSINLYNTNDARKRQLKEQVSQNVGSDGLVTLTYVNGVPYSVKNPQDLGEGNENKSVFLKAKDGTIKPVISSQITEWESKNPDEIINGKLSEQDTVDDAVEQEQQLQQEASDKGLEEGKTVETPHGKKTLVSVNPDGTSTVIDNKGEESIVNTTEIEPYKTSEQKEAEKAEAGLDIFEGIEEGAEVLADEPLTDESDIRVVDFSNGQSKIVAPEGVQLFNTPEEKNEAIKQLVSGEMESAQESLDDLPPEQAFAQMLREDPDNPDIANELFAEEINTIRAQAEESRAQVKETSSRKEKQALLIKAKQLEAEAQRLDAILSDPSLLEKQVEEEVIEAPAPTPEEISEQLNQEYIQEQENTPYNQLLPWQQELLDSKISKDSFERWSDASNVTQGMARGWFVPKGQQSSANDIDALADDLSDTHGIEITPQDIVDFIIENPNSSVRKTTDRMNEIVGEYRALTGKSIKGHEQLIKEEAEQVDDIEGSPLGKAPDDVPFRTEGVNISETAAVDVKHRQNAIKELNKMQELWGIPINIINSNELSQEAQAKAREVGAPKAFYQNGEVYIISDQITSVSDVKKSYMHEAILHKGLDLLFDAGPVSILGKSYETKNDLLDEVFSRMDDNSIIERANIYFKGVKIEDLTTEQKREVAEEALATLNETESPRLQAMLDKLYNYLKKLLGFTTKQFTKADLRNMLREHRELVMRTEGQIESKPSPNIESKFRVDDYQGEHQAPVFDGSKSSMDDMSDIYPEDVYEPIAATYYSTGEVYDRESLAAIRSAKDKPNTRIKVYRAVPDNAKDIRKERGDLNSLYNYYRKFRFFPMNDSLVDQLSDKFPFDEYGYDGQQQAMIDYIVERTDFIDKELKAAKLKIEDGNWVTPSKSYAEDHGRSSLGGKYKILSKTVRADELFSEGNSIHEFGYQSKKEQNKDVKFRATPSKVNENLVVLHNLNADNIINIDKVGGLPVPSLAVARTDIPFTAFGDISLIADKSMVDPQDIKGARTFNTDVYSPRYPSVNYDVNYKKFTDTFKEANEIASKHGIPTASLGGLDLESDGLRTLKNNDVAYIAYLLEKGSVPRPKMRDVNIDPSLHKYIKKGWVDTNALVSNPEFIKDITALFKKKDEARGRDMFLKDGVPNENLLYREAATISSANAIKEPDVSASKEAIYKRAVGTPNKRKEFEAWIADKWESMVDKERIFKGFTPSGDRKYIPHTLDNVVKELTKGLQGEEGTFYGVGSVRSGAAKEFKSIEGIQADRDKIVTSDVMNELKEEVNEEFTDILELVKPYYKFDTEAWGYSNDAGQGLTEYAKKGRSSAFKAFPKGVKNEVNEFLGKLQNMPTEYFESKVQRAVGLDEFTAAVVPKDTPQDVIDILEKNNVKIKKYNPKTKGDRLKKVELASRQEGVKFRVAESPKELEDFVKDSKVKETVYHGTPEGGFDEFSPEKKGIRTNHDPEDVGYHFTNDKDYAKSYSLEYRKIAYPTLMESLGYIPDHMKVPENAMTYNVRLNMTNPMPLPHAKIDRKTISEAKEKGYDSIIGKVGETTKDYVVFEPSQILIEPKEDVKFRVEDKERVKSIAESLLDKEGFKYYFANLSNTPYGTSVYYNVYKDDNKVKVRFSDHSVENTDRMRNEAHFHLYKPNNESSVNRLKYMLGDSDVEYGPTEMISKQIEVPEHKLEADAKILSQRVSSKGNKIYTVEILQPTNYQYYKKDTNAKVEEAAEEVNTNPSEDQKEAGNYKMGHIRFDGFDVSIENPAGSIRSGVDKDGERWSNLMPSDYGYIKGTKGADKDHIDVFMGENLKSDKVYVIDQVNEDGSFDEHKVMMGYNSLAEARNAYMEAYDEGWSGLGAITRTTKDGLKEWFKGDTNKPFATLDGDVRFRMNDDPIKWVVEKSDKSEMFTGNEKSKKLHNNIEKLTSNTGSVRYIKYNDSNKPVSGIQIVTMGDKALIANAYTMPDERRKGYAKELALKAKSDYPTLKHSEFLEDDGKKFAESVKFRATSSDPEVQKLLDKLQAVENLGKTAAKLKGLEDDKLKALGIERDYIQGQINTLKEGAELSKQDTQLMIKEVQKAITDYAKKSLPMTETGAREIGAVLTLVKDAQTPEAIEKAFNRIDELAGVTTDKTERKKYVSKVNRLLKWMTGLKKSGTKKVGKFNYEDSKQFQELKELDENISALTKKANSWKSSAEEKMEAEKDLDKLWDGINEKENKTALDDVMMKLIELKRLGSKASPKLAKIVSEELEVIYNQAKEAKSGADMVKSFQRKEDREMVKDFLRDNSLRDKGWFKRAMTNINSKTADIVGNWETILTMIGGQELRDDMSFLVEESDIAVGKQESTNNILSQAKDIYGVKSKTGTLNTIHELSKEDYELRKPNRFGEEGEGDPTKLSKLDLMDIYNAIKNERIRDDYYMSYGDIAMAEDGSRDTDAQYADGKERIDGLVDKLSPEDKAFADAMQEELDKYYDKANEVHIKLYNRDLPRVDNYWPSTAERTKDIDPTEQFGADFRYASAMNERVQHRTPVPGDAFNKFNKHVEEMEWMVNMALPFKRVHDVFKDNNVRSLIESARGEKFTKLLDESLVNTTLNAPAKLQQKSELDKALSPLLNNWVTSKIGATPSVPVKQLLSAVNYSENMPTGQWMSGFTKGLMSPKDTWKEMMKIPYLKTRLGDGYSEAVQRALNGDENVHQSKTANYHQAFKNLMTIGTRYGDIAAITFGGKPYLDYLIKEGMKKEGAVKSEVEKEAVDKFLEDTLRSQQAPFPSSMSKLQNSKNSFFRAAFAFANTPSQYMRKLFEANQNLRVQSQMYKKGKISKDEFNKAKKQTRKAHQIYALINTVSFTAVGALMGAAMRGSDWDDELWKDMLVQLEQTYIGGLPLIKDFVGGATKQALGMKIYDDSKPFVEGIDEAVTAGIKLLNGTAKDEKKEYEKIGQGIATMSGVPYYNLKKDYNALFNKEETYNKTRAREANDKLNKIQKSDDAPRADAAKELKGTYSRAKSKATKLKKESKFMQAEMIENIIQTSKVNMWESDYSTQDMKFEAEMFNNMVDGID